MITPTRPRSHLPPVSLAPGLTCPRSHLPPVSLAPGLTCPRSHLPLDILQNAACARRTRHCHLPDTGWIFPLAALTPADALALAPGIPHGEALRTTLGKLAYSVSPALSALM